MPDWKRVIRSKFRTLSVFSPDFMEELAAHLEDSYEALLYEGWPAEAAFQRTSSQVEGRCRVRLVMRFLEEELMTGFIRRIAVPGLLTSAAAWFFCYALEPDHCRNKIIWLLGGQLPLWWWCMLPIFAVLGAILSRPNGRSLPQRIASSLLPGAILGIFVLVIFVVGFTISGFTHHYQSVFARLELMALVPPGFVLIPAAFSMMGAGIAGTRTGEFRHVA